MRRLGDQSGLTLVELLVATAITGLIAGTLGTTVHQFFMTAERGNDELKALHDVQNAGSWLNLDGERAETTNLIDAAPPAGSMSLSWTSGSQPHTVTYSLSGTELQRNHNGTTITVAHHVSGLQFSISDRLVTVMMTSTPEGRWGISKQAEYRIWLRPAE